VFFAATYIQAYSFLLVNPLEPVLSYFSTQYFYFSEIILCFGSFPGFARLSFWYEQPVSKDEYNVLVELYWQRENPVLVTTVFTTIPTCTDMEWILELRGEGLANYRLWHGKAVLKAFYVPELCINT
jgi:hypothetical protein